MHDTPPPERIPGCTGRLVDRQRRSGLSHGAVEAVLKLRPSAPRRTVQDSANGTAPNLPTDRVTRVEVFTARAGRVAPRVAEHVLTGLPRKALLPPVGVCVGGQRMRMGRCPTEPEVHRI